jgi:hypothetical protein
MDIHHDSFNGTYILCPNCGCVIVIEPELRFVQDVRYGPYSIKCYNPECNWFYWGRFIGQYVGR